MSVPSPTSQSAYVGTGLATVYNTGFYFLLASTVVVKLTPIATGIEAVLVLGVDYTITMPAGIGLNGSITMLVAPAVDDVLVIERTVPLTQVMSLRQQGSFSPAIHEDALDRSVFIDQQHDRRITELEGLAGGLVGTLTFGEPVEITDSTTGPGSGLEVARSNHQHAHGERAGGAQHAVAVSGGAAGFQSGADKAKIDAIPTARTHLRAYRNSVQNIGLGVETTIVFNTEADDDLSEYDPATGIFTAAESGIYLVCANVKFDVATVVPDDTGQIFLQKNGAGIYAITGDQAEAATANRNFYATLATSIRLAAGDTLRIKAIGTVDLVVLDIGGAHSWNSLTIDRLV